MDEGYCHGQQLSGQGRQYLKSLPEALYTLPQWETRLLTRKRLSSTNQDSSFNCLQKAREAFIGNDFNPVLLKTGNNKLV